MFFSVFSGQCRQGALKFVQKKDQPFHKNKSDRSYKNPVSQPYNTAVDDIDCAGRHEHIDSCVEEFDPK